jgi:hypothetical protein
MTPHSLLLGDGFGRGRGEKQTAGAVPSGLKALAFREDKQMGMDVIGRNPSEDCGQYFRASVWMWRPLHQQMVELCDDLLDEELLRAMEFNDGAGPEKQETCTEMAHRFEQALLTNQDGFFLDSPLRVTEEGRFVRPEELAKDPTLKTYSPYRACRGSVMHWVRFLQSCGGFAVW